MALTTKTLGEDGSGGHYRREVLSGIVKQKAFNILLFLSSDQYYVIIYQALVVPVVPGNTHEVEVILITLIEGTGTCGLL